MSTEKMLKNLEQAAIDAKKSQERKEETILSNAKYKVVGSLRTQGATQISVKNVEMKDNEIFVTARYMFKDTQEGTFKLKMNGVGGYSISNMEASLEGASTIKNGFFIEQDAKINANDIADEDHMNFDLSLITAKEIAPNKFEISYPMVGDMGVVSKDNVTLDTVKKLCAMSADSFERLAKFSGDFKVNYTDSVMVTASSDKTVNAYMGYKSFVKSNMEGKENDIKNTLRSNFIKSIELKAQNIIRQKGTNYKTGAPKIVETNSVLKLVNEKFEGSILVKAKIGDKIVTYDLPVVKGGLIVQGSLDTYKKEESVFKDELRQKIEDEIKASIKLETEILCKKEYDEMEQLTKSMDKIFGGRVSDIQKTFLVEKKWLEEKGIEIKEGTILNLKGNKYSVEMESNGIMCNLVLVP